MLERILFRFFFYGISVLFGSFWIAMAALSLYRKYTKESKRIYRKFLSDEITWAFLRNNLDEDDSPLPYFWIIVFILVGNVLTFLGIHSVWYEVWERDSGYFLIDLFFAILSTATYIRAWTFGYKLIPLSRKTRK